ncbi:MAG TPA: hypothetical protein VG291_01000 [Xanthobacteraceae bacterium]|nr:hypothetical protein [Xanthobacteraceae bacterium]
MILLIRMPSPDVEPARQAMPLHAFITARSAATRLIARGAMVLGAMLCVLAGSHSALAQLKVRTETIKPPAAAAPPSTNQFVPPARDGSPIGSPVERPAAAGETPALAPGAATPEIAADLSHLPPAVVRMRDRILAAAHTGDLQTLMALMRANGGMPVFSHTQKQDPAAYWREIYPDSDGVEILSILIGILETPPARIGAGTPQETYVWPYFARLPVRSLTPVQKVELFRVVTGSDYKQMLERGRYIFYQVGIGPDGTWRYFLASE